MTSNLSVTIYSTILIYFLNIYRLIFELKQHLHVLFPHSPNYKNNLSLFKHDACSNFDYRVSIFLHQ